MGLEEGISGTDFFKYVCLKRTTIKVFKQPNGMFKILFPDNTSYICDESHLSFYEDISNEIREFEISEKPEPNRASVVTRWGTFDPKKEKKNLFRMNIKDLIKDPDMKKETPISLEIVFELPISKAVGKRDRALMLENKLKHVKRPDVDNLQKFLLDTLKALAFHDDSQIWDIHVRKIHSEVASTKVKIRYG
jgi:Holliday junction resolvase RusA-like endonuclease